MLLVRVRGVEHCRQLLDPESAKRFVAVHVVRHCSGESSFKVRTVVLEVVDVEYEGVQELMYRNDSWMCLSARKMDCFQRGSRWRSTYTLPISRSFRVRLVLIIQTEGGAEAD